MRACYLPLLCLSFLSIGQSDKQVHLFEQCAYWDSQSLDSLAYYVHQITDLQNDFDSVYLLYFKTRIQKESNQKDQFQKVVEAAIELEDYALAGLAHYRIGRLFSADGQFPMAMESYEQAHSLFDQASINGLIDAVRRKCVTYTSQAYISNQTNRYEAGISYSLSSLRLAEGNGYDDLKLISYLNLSASYGELGSPDNRLGTQEERDRYSLQAKQHMFLAASLAEELGDQRRAHRTYGNIGMYYTFNDQLDSARYYLNRAIQISKDLGDARGLANHYNMLALVYQKNDQFAQAEEVSLKAMKYATEVRSEQMKADIFLTLGELSLKQNKIESARRQLVNSLEISKRLGLPKTAAHALSLLAEIAVTESKWEDAYTFHRESIILRDSVASQENFNRIEELRTQYETEKKEQQIVNLEQTRQIANLKIRQQRTVMLISGIGILAALVVGYSFYRTRTLKLSQQKLLVEQKLLRSQMNPHFLFNALSSIHAFIFKGDKREAADYLTTFSELTRDILDHSAQEWITLEEELNTLEKYVTVQKLRFQNVESTIMVADNIEADNLLIPPMLLQPFVENAFEHGFKERKEGNIDVLIQSSEEQLEISIKDDGIGLQFQSDSHDPKAISIAQERLHLLYPKHKTQLSIQNRTDKSGVWVSITVPKEYAL